MEDNKLRTVAMIISDETRRRAMPNMVIPQEVNYSTAHEASHIIWQPLSGVGIQFIFIRADLHAYGQNLPYFTPLGLDD